MARFTSKKRELMRAVLRLSVAAFSVGLALAPLAAFAQSAATNTSSADTPATDAIGPRDLQNFNLNGTVTRSAEPGTVPRVTSRPAAQQPAPGADGASARSAALTPAAPATARPQRIAERAAARAAGDPPATNVA